jgi:hypothetical protein
MQLREEPTAAVENHAPQGLAELDARPMPAIELSEQKNRERKVSGEKLARRLTRFSARRPSLEEPGVPFLTLSLTFLWPELHTSRHRRATRKSRRKVTDPMLCRAILDARFEQAI